MVPLGVATAFVMSRFHSYQLPQPGSEPFLIIPFFDMAAFGTLLALSTSWRKKTELHRRLHFVTTCGILDAAFARFDFIFDHALFLFCPDLWIGLGLVRDLLVNKRIHPVYLISLPSLLILHAVVTLIWRSEAAWWVRIAHAVLA
jgi:hypothetical protein